MQLFNPQIHIAAVDDHDTVVTFDSAAIFDSERSVRALRIERRFRDLSVAIEGFDEVSTREGDEAVEYRGTVRLRVKSADSQDQDLVLAQLQLRPVAIRSWVGARAYPTAEQVAHHVRQGIATAFGRALKAYYEKEEQLDTLARTANEPAADALPGPPELARSSGIRSRARGRALPSSLSDQRRSRARMIAAVVGAPVLLIACLMIISPRKHDPIADAVARSMIQNPASVQEQVDLTTRTLKQMGLDPGRSNDVGCLASSP
jgi:hypothetical protein